ncbi:MAG: PAS domain S-box protein, partial [Desulfatiglandaceae bacterium]
MFEDIVETIPHPFLVLDLDLRILKVNHFFCETFKIAPEKTTGNFIYDLGNRQWDIPKLRRLLEDIISKDHKFENFEVEHIFPSIGRRIMMLNGRRLKQHGTGSQMILLCIEDITEKREMENALIESEERFRRLFETANDGILLLEKREFKVRYANPSITAMLGYSNKECIGNDIKDIGLPDVLDTPQEMLQTLNKDGIIHYKDVPARKKNGQVIDTDIYMVDKATLVQCNVRDITARHLGEEALRKSEEKFRNLFENLYDAYYSTDPTGLIFMASPSVEKLLGYKSDEIVGLDMKSLYVNAQEREEFLSQIMRNG